MTDNDTKKISRLMDSKLDKFRDEIKVSISASEEGIRGEISASEERLRGEISGSERKLRKELSASEKRVIKGLVDFVSDQLIPVIDEKADKSDIDRIERKLDYYGARTMENSVLS